MTVVDRLVGKEKKEKKKKRRSTGKQSYLHEWVTPPKI